jgi:hypothetical protein
MYQVFATSGEMNASEKSMYVAFIQNLGKMACIECLLVVEEGRLNPIKMEQLK